MEISLEHQLACARRELRMRRQLYPAWVQMGRMRQSTADFELAAMEAIALTIQHLLEQESPQMPLLTGETS
jgi:hypothetical protein